MKRYLFFGIIASGCLFLWNKTSAAEEHIHDVLPYDTAHHAKHAEHSHGGHENRVDPFGGPYKSAGADCAGFALCPASSPHSGYHTSIGDWDIMAHGNINLTYTIQPSPRGKSAFAAPNHVMVMGEHGGVFGGNFRLGLGLSFDSLTEPSYGKPQLFQTGEENKRGGENVDNQHRHPLITNLSATYVRPFSSSGNSDWFCQAALIGDVSGVPMEYHRASAWRFPDVSLFHHGTTNLHSASSVFLCGIDVDKMRFALATFHGQEPGRNPYVLYLGTPDSFAGSFQYFPTKNWAFSLYFANIHRHERTDPGNIKRFTAAAMYTHPLEDGDWWATTLAVTHDKKTSGKDANVIVIDSTVKKGRNYFYGRIDAGQKPASALLETNTFGRPGLVSAPSEMDRIDGVSREKNLLIGAGTVGYARTLWQNGGTEIGIGADVTGYVLPPEVKKVYGAPVTGNAYFFLRF